MSDEDDGGEDADGTEDEERPYTKSELRAEVAAISARENALRPWYKRSGVLTLGVIGLLVVLVLAAVAIGGGDGGSPPTTAASLAERIGCDTFEQETQSLELGSREQGYCELGEETVSLHTYTSNSGRDRILDFVEGSGFGSGFQVVGDRFVVRTTTQAAATRVQAAVGGAVR